MSAVNGRHSIEALTRAAGVALDGLVQALCFALAGHDGSIKQDDEAMARQLEDSGLKASFAD